METELKVCRKCHYEKPITEFTITDRVRGYRKSRCKACENIRVRAYYAANVGYREKSKKNSIKQAKQNPVRQALWVRRAGLKKKYGLTEPQYDALVAAQNNRCALCRSETVGSGQWANGHWHVDHDHGDGHVRGLLCQQCNTQLGGYEALLEKVGEDVLLDYLTRPCPVPPAPPPVIIPEPVYRKVDVLPPVRKRRELGVCSVEGCEKPEKEAGYCGMHYQRIQRAAKARNKMVADFLDEASEGQSLFFIDRLPHTSAKGAAHWKSNLTEADIRFIRASELSGARLAEKFGVTRASISAIRARKTWKHVTDA